MSEETVQKYIYLSLTVKCNTGNNSALISIQKNSIYNSDNALTADCGMFDLHLASRCQCCSDKWEIERLPPPPPYPLSEPTLDNSYHLINVGKHCLYMYILLSPPSRSLFISACPLLHPTTSYIFYTPRGVGVGEIKLILHNLWVTFRRNTSTSSH